MPTRLNGKDSVPIENDLSVSFVSESVSDCCLMPIQQFFNYIVARTS